MIILPTAATMSFVATMQIIGTSRRAGAPDSREHHVRQAASHAQGDAESNLVDDTYLSATDEAETGTQNSAIPRQASPYGWGDEDPYGWKD